MGRKRTGRFQRLITVSELLSHVTYTLVFGAPRGSVEFGFIAAPKPVTYSRFSKGPRLPYVCDQILRCPLDEEKGLIVTVGNSIRTFEHQIEAEGHLWRAYASSEFTAQPGRVK